MKGFIKLHEIIDGLWLGNIDASYAVKDSPDFDAILNVSKKENLPLLFDHPKEYFKLSLRCSASTDNLNLLISSYYILSYCHFLKKYRTLVHCSAGRVRSPSVIALYLMVRYGISLEEASKTAKCQSKLFNELIITAYKSITYKE